MRGRHPGKSALESRAEQTDIAHSWPGRQITFRDQAGPPALCHRHADDPLLMFPVTIIAARASLRRGVLGRFRA